MKTDTQLAQDKPPVPHWRRLLLALGMGLLATPVGSAAGAILLGVVGAAFEGWHVLRGLPAFIFYGIIFGPVLAWPVTLVVLPGVWLFCPHRHRRGALLIAGPLAGAAVLAERVLIEAGPTTVGSVMVAAGAVGGLAAGAVFRAFAARPDASVSTPPLAS